MRTTPKLAYLFFFSVISLTLSGQGLVGIYFAKDLSGETNYPMILGIVDGSAAEQAGLKIGQRIKTIDGKDADLTKTDQAIVLSWTRGLPGTTLELLVTQPNDITKTEAVKFTRGTTPTAANRLTNVAQVSRYFAARIWSCFDALENRAESMMTELIETSETYNGKELKKWRVTEPFMNEIHEGTFESYTDKSPILERDIYHDKLSFVLVTGVENDFLAQKYYEETKAALNKALENKDSFAYGKFSEGEENIEKQGESAYSFGSFSKKTEKSTQWESWENKTFFKLTSFILGELGNAKRAALSSKLVYLKLIGDGFSWKVVIEIELQSTL